MTTLQAAQYWMLHRIYERFRVGKLPKEDGQALKTMILAYDQLSADDRRLLLDSFIESWSDNPQTHFTAIKAVSKLYLEEI